MLHLPFRVQKRTLHFSHPSLRFGRIIPSTTLSSRCLCTKASKEHRRFIRRNTSKGSSVIDSPIPWQQAEHPTQSWQSAFTISLLLYNLPSDISLISTPLHPASPSLLYFLRNSFKHVNVVYHSFCLYTRIEDFWILSIYFLFINLLY